MENKKCKRCNEYKPISLFRFRYNKPLSYCHECELEYRREWYYANKERAKASSKKWKSSNKERLKEFERVRHLKRYSIEREKTILRVKEYIAKNKDKIRERAHQYYLKNKEAIKRNVRIYQLANNHKIRIFHRENESKRREGSEHFTREEWIDLCSKFEYRCICPEHWEIMTIEKLTIDHIVPICKGGTNDIRNIQPLCRYHNHRKGRRIIDYRQQAIERIGLV